MEEALNRAAEAHQILAELLARDLAKDNFGCSDLAIGRPSPDWVSRKTPSPYCERQSPPSRSCPLRPGTTDTFAPGWARRTRTSRTRSMRKGGELESKEGVNLGYSKERSPDVTPPGLGSPHLESDNGIRVEPHPTV